MTQEDRTNRNAGERIAKVIARTGVASRRAPGRKCVRIVGFVPLERGLHCHMLLLRAVTKRKVNTDEPRDEGSSDPEVSHRLCDV